MIAETHAHIVALATLAASSEAAFFMYKLGHILKGQLNMGGRGAVSSSGRGINATSIGSWLQGRADDGEKFNEENFMNSTIGLITSQNATAPKRVRETL